MVVHVDRCGADAGRVSRLAVVGLVCVHPVPPRPLASNSMLAARVRRSYGLLAGWNCPVEPYRPLVVTCETPLERLSAGRMTCAARCRSRVVRATETSQEDANGSDAKLHPGCRSGRANESKRRANACWH